MKLYNMEFDEWIQNDWESDDYIEQESMRETTKQETVPEGEWTASKRILAVLLILFKIAQNPIFWIIILILIFRS